MTALTVAQRLCLCIAFSPSVHRSALAATVTAPPAPEKTTIEADREAAREQFREGLALLDTGQYARALACFERAYQAWNNPKIILNIAAAQRALGQLSKAANNYARYQRAAGAGAARAQEVEQILATLDAGLGRLIVSQLDPGQRVWLDDEELSLEAEQPIRVEPGEHTLRIHRTDTSTDTRPITVWPGELLRVNAARPRATQTPDSITSADEEEQASPEPRPSPASRVGILARADVDVARRGALGALGAAVALTDFLRASGGVLLGAHQGGWLGLELVPWRQRVAPVLGLSAPLFFMEGVYPGVSAELGLRVELTRRITPFARASVSHFPSAPPDYARTLFIPSLGVEVGL